ncbi:MAG: 3-oxoacyl-ACP synthase III family protein [Pseudomonadota bacterium]
MAEDAVIVYLEDIGAYVPEARVDNARFSELTGKEPEWFVARTGIHARSRAAADETTTSMALAAVRRLLEKRPSVLTGVDLIIGATYTPEDTLSTMPFRLQRELGIAEARVYFLSSACSSFISGLELARIMVRSGEARRVLLVASEHNSRYSDDADRFSGHLWGDGAAAAVISDVQENAAYSLEYARSRGVACAGKGPEALGLDPILGQHGLVMHEGRDVFARACEYLADETRTAMASLGLTVADIAWLVPHQANLRILTHVAKALGLPVERCLVTVDQLGNTGCASIPITLELAGGDVAPGDIVATTAFGGGYSCGAAILRKL